MRLRHLPVLLACVLSCPTAPAAPLLAPRPVVGPQPLLYVQLRGPEGMHATVYPVGPRGHDLPTPVTLGLRPGYIYRIELNGMARRPGISLYPTLEVRGTVCLPPNINARDFPAPVVLTEDDIDAVLHGALIEKVIYLEHPDRAAPVATQPSEPLELTLSPRTELLESAREVGRPVLIFRLGQRQMTPQQLAQETAFGTILLPDERVLAQPRVGPVLPWASWQWYDPIHGPRPFEEECIRNGGISTSKGVWPLGTPVGMRPGLDQAGRLRGLQPEDAVAEYTDSKGRKHMVCSNEVCLVVPRYAVLRREIPLVAYQGSVGLSGAGTVRAQSQMRLRLPSLQAHQYEHMAAVQGRKRPSEALVTQGVVPIRQLEVLHANIISLGVFEAIGTKQVNVLTEVERALILEQIHHAAVLSQDKGTAVNKVAIGTAVVGRVDQGPEIIRAVAETRSLTVCGHEAPCPPDKPLTLFKWVDRKVGKPGDVVTFHLRYTNQGGRAMTDLAVTDSLSPRLEYIPGTARSDRDAVFTTQQNEAGSLVLRWEVSGRLLPGHSGTVTFQARVR